MKYFSLALAFIFIYIQNLTANNNQSPLKNAWTFNLGELHIADTYLSPLQYSGISYSLNVEHENKYKSKHPIIWEVNHNWKYSALTNPAFSSLMHYFSLNLAWCNHYQWSFTEMPKSNNILYLEAGAKLNTEAGIKYVGRNINNPASVDFGIGIDASFRATYIIKTKPLNLSFQYHITTPIIGTMLIPKYVQPYYDIMMAPWENISFASIHNKYGVNGSLNIDLAFNNFTLRTSFNHNHIFCNANKLYFHQKELSGGIGIIIYTNIFWGKNK